MSYAPETVRVMSARVSEFLSDTLMPRRVRGDAEPYNISR